MRVAPRKARLVADLVRGLPLEDALPLLRFSTRSAAQDIRKLLESAAANAETNHDLVADDLLIKDIHVDEGPTLRRYRPRALGRATRINKRTSHIAVALTPEDSRSRWDRRSIPRVSGVGYIHDWKSNWYNEKEFADYLNEDLVIRSHIENKLSHAGLSKRSSRRAPARLRSTSRPRGPAS